MRYGGRRRIAISGLVATVTLTGITAAGNTSAGWSKADRPDFTLTILHNNDGESALLPQVIDLDPSAEGEDLAEYGGIARFTRKVDTLRRQSGWATYDRGEAFKRGVVLLNSGDNYLAGTRFQASQQPGAPFYDGLAVKRLRYDALAIGNHEFDFGPATLARFIETVGRTPFVSANLDFSEEPSLATLAAEGRIVSSTIIRERGERIGVVGLTTPVLRTISSPGAVEISPEIIAIAQAEVDALTKRKVNKIILVSHLQGLAEEIALASSLKNVDVIIGGGGDELLADEGDELIPGDEANVFGSYPQIVQDASGKQVPIVTTPGNYRYVGQLQVTFDRKGNVLSWDDADSGLQIVTDRGPAAVGLDRFQLKKVQEPVAAFVAGLKETIIGSSDVDLDCERAEVRGLETNCANLIADGILAAGQAQAATFDLDTPQIGIINGGGIRGEIDQVAGPISLDDTFRLQPFGNFIAVAEDVPGESLRQLFEEGATRLPASGEGGFAHPSDGTILVIDPTQPARITDASTGAQITPGARVRTLILADGTVVVQDGVTQNVTVTVVGLNFSLAGGDAYPVLPFTTIGVSDQQALQTYIQGPLGGVVSAAQYPRGGEGRITILPVPAP